MVNIYFRYKISSNAYWNELREVLDEVSIITVLDDVGVPTIVLLLHHLQVHPAILVQIKNDRSL